MTQTIKRKTVERELAQRMEQVEASLVSELARIRRYRDENYRDIAAATMLVSHAGDAALAQLNAGRRGGKSGWWDRERVPMDDLIALCGAKMTKRDYVGLMVYAVMLWVRDVDARLNPDPAEEEGAPKRVAGAAGPAADPSKDGGPE